MPSIPEGIRVLFPPRPERGWKRDLAGMVDRIFKVSRHPGDLPVHLLLLGRFDGEWRCMLFRRVRILMALEKGPYPAADEVVDALFLNGMEVCLNIDGAPPAAGAWDALGIRPPRRNLVAHRTGDAGTAAVDFGGRVGRSHLRVAAALAAATHFFVEALKRRDEAERAFLYTVDALARAAESHDEDTGEHIVRVGLYSKSLAEALGCSRRFAATLEWSARMHDVGKLHVHPDLLRKPGRLTPEEWREVKMHTLHALHILGDDPRLDMAREVAVSHHERWSGGGYPYGLAGEDIPLPARIVMMADTYDALRSARPYKPPFSHAEALGIIMNGDGRLEPRYFDPRVLEAFGDIHPLMEEIYESIRDRE